MAFQLSHHDHHVAVITLFLSFTHSSWLSLVHTRHRGLGSAFRHVDPIQCGHFTRCHGGRSPPFHFTDLVNCHHESRQPPRVPILQSPSSNCFPEAQANQWRFLWPPYNQYPIFALSYTTQASEIHLLSTGTDNTSCNQLDEASSYNLAPSS